MPIEGFNYQEFAMNLAQQAQSVLPGDLSDEEKKFVVNIVNNFCYLAGEAISKDTSFNFTLDNACIITQFIGEWAFHKAVDLVRGKIDPQFREAILQKVAFTVFEIAKQAIIRKLPQDQMINVVEYHVKKVFDEALADLHKQGALTDEHFKKAVSQSNIDDMAKADNDAIAQASDLKILKLAAFAMLLKQMPNDKAGSILNKFDPADAKVLIQYLQMDDLEAKVDPVLVAKCLSEIKMTLPEPKKINTAKMLLNFSKTVKKANNVKLEELIQNERFGVKTFIKKPNADSSEFGDMSPRVMQLVCKHIEEKLNDNKTKA